ncbi:RDD family protein [Streptomyces sp. NPDC101227]|uniref:RDD family protein n=1 Tax=Streptomyces sp. NPDC101227 TaxID=3366136 RepID=UPI0037F1DE20
MSAPTSGSAGDSPTPGFYPDPSIPGYIRYWNGAAWVPGTSRPAPAEGEAMPAPPPGAAPAPPAFEETGPVFLDEDTGGAHMPAVRQSGQAEAQPAVANWDDPSRLHGTSPEPASAWQADASRQGGFGGEGDHRVSWGSPEPGQAPAGTPSGAPSWGAVPGQREEQAAAESGDPAGTPSLRKPGVPADGTVAIRAVKPGRDAGQGAAADHGTTAIRAVKPGRGAPADQGTTAIRAVRPGPGGAADPGSPAEPAKGNQTMAFRLPRGGAAPQSAPQSPPPAHAAPQSLPSVGAPQQSAPQQGAPQHGGPAQQPPGVQGFPGQAGQPPQAAAPPAGFPPQGGAAPGADGVIPWKPPTADVFFAAAQAAQGHPAPLGRRLAARLIDSAVLAAITAAVAVPLWGTVTDHIDAKVEAAKQSGRQVTVYLLDGTTTPIFAIVLAVLLIGGGLYEVLPTLKWGRTLGKKLCGVRLLDIEGHDTPPLGAVLKRWFCYSVLGLLAIGIVNVVWCLFDQPWRQCWHDKLARTFVASDAARAAD